jgi:Ribbon-helix-helix protein, copG family
MVYGTLMSMTKTTLYLPVELQRELRDEAKRSGRPQADIVREALTTYLTARPRRLPRSIGIAENGALPARETEEWLRAQWGSR